MFGRSVYLSSFDDENIKENLKKLKPGFVFSSFHISEEFSHSYCLKAKEMCLWLCENGFEIIADVSKKTLEKFNCKSLLHFADEMNISVLRIDYGFTHEEIKNAAKSMPVAVNASTVDNEIAKDILNSGSFEKDVYAIHNFYPRPETGLDVEFFNNLNFKLKGDGIKVLAFIAGDENLRAPIYKGLPTLEKHRNVLPYIAFLDMIKNYSIDHVLLGDPGISNLQANLIDEYLSTGVICIPCCIDDEFKELYGKTFTIRYDSPSSIARFLESREYSTFGKVINPRNCIERKRGSITIDNIGYARYSGEIQLVKRDFGANKNVNVIGKVKEEYLGLLDCLMNGEKFKLIGV